ncbi:MAG: peptidylprolyl isomerase [Bryobacteraceae bacterium]
MKYLSLLLCLGTAFAADVTVIEQIVAKVNGDIVTRGELERSRRQMEADMKQRGMTAAQIQEAVREREKNFLRERIDQLLLVQKGKELDLKVDPDVTKYIAELQLKSKIAEPEKFQAFVKEQTGMSYEDFKQETKNSILTQRVVSQEVQGRISVSKAEVEKYYNEHKGEFNRDERVFLRQILISTDGKDAAGIAASEKKAKDIVARARKGEKFYELAQANSDDATAQQGGDAGSFTRGQLKKEIADIVFNADRGFVTEPMKQSNGFLILRVDERFKQGLASMDEVDQEIREKLFRPMFEPKMREYLTRLRTDAFLEIRDGYLDTGAAPGKDTRWQDPAQLRAPTVTKEEVANKLGHKKLLWAIPVPGTHRPATSSSR